MNEKHYDLAIVIHSLKVGGSEKFVLSLTNKFSEHGLDVLLILLELDNPLLEKLDNRVDHLVLTRRFKYDLGIAYRIREKLKLFKIQKLLCVEPYSLFLTKLGTFLSRFPSTIFLSLHHSKPTKWKKRWMDIFFLKTVSRADKVIFICQYQKECFSSAYFFSPGFAKVIYNGIDVDYFSPHRTITDLSKKNLGWRFRLGISEHEPAIVMIGRLSPEKGHRYAIDALDHLYRMHNIRAHLIIIGDGQAYLRAELYALAEQLNVQDQVYFEGTKLDVRPYLLTGDLFALTSISETFSLAALEAMSMGMPCALTNVGGAKELIVNDRLGGLCKPEDALSIACSWATILLRQNDRAYIRDWVVNHYREQSMVGNYIQALGLNHQYSEANELY